MTVKVISCKWVYSIKLCYDGTLDWYKAWLLLLLHKVDRFIKWMLKMLFSMVISKRKFTWHYLLVWSLILPWMSISWRALYMDWNRLFKPGLTNFEPPCFNFLFSKASMTLPCFFARHLQVLFFSLSMLLILLLLGQISSWLPVW